MSNIEAIIVDGVRYDKVKAKTEFVCERMRVAREGGDGRKSRTRGESMLIVKEYDL